MAWIKVYGEIWESWKIPTLCEALKIEEAQAVGHLVSLWCFTERNAWRDGDLSRWGTIGISRAAKWHGDPAAFVSALQGAAFLQGMVVHEWKEHQAGMIHDRERRIPAKAAPAPAQNPREIPADSPRDTGLDKIREDKSREENNLLSDKSDGFVDFWKAYPRKTGKAAAAAAWKKARPSLDKCLKTLKWQTVSAQWTKDGGQFIPKAASWIMDGCWDDVPLTHDLVECQTCGHQGTLKKGHAGSVKCGKCGSDVKPV